MMTADPGPELALDWMKRRIVRKDGTIRYELVSAAPIFDDAGRVIAGYLVMMDITELKQAEEALRESEEKHRILLEESSDPIFSFTPEGQYTYANPAFAKGVGEGTGLGLATV